MPSHEFSELLAIASVTGPLTVDALLRTIDEHPTLRRAYLRGCLERDLRQLQRKRRMVARQAQQRDAAAVDRDAPDAFSLLPATTPPEQVLRRWLLRNAHDEPVPILGWTKRELELARQRCLQAGQASYHAAQFLKGIAEALNENELVSDRFTYHQLVALWDSLTVESKVVSARLDQQRFRGILATLTGGQEDAEHLRRISG